MSNEDYDRGREIGQLMGRVDTLVEQLQNQNKNIIRLFEKIDTYGKCYRDDIARVEEKHSKKIDRIESALTHLTALYKSHVQDKATHFNPYFDESPFAKIRRKKAEYSIITIAGGGLGSVLYLIIISLLRLMEGG